VNIPAADATRHKIPWRPGVQLVALVIFLGINSVFGQFYSGSQLTFGKSRVQYKNFLWLYFRFEKFDTYYYLNGKELAEYCAEYSDKHIKEIELELQSVLEQKIQFIIFNNLSDLKQSNIGMYGDWDSYNTGGVTRIIGGKVLIYFDGDYRHFEQQIKAGITQVLLNQMMYGTGIGAQIKNNALFTMPDWYMNGLISYISRKWDSDIDNAVMDAVLNGKFEKVNSLSGLDAANAGHSIWNYIAMKYGDATIPNIVYMTRLTRSIEKGFMNVLGVEYKTVVRDWSKYYRDVYSSQITGRENPGGDALNNRNKPDRVFRQLKISPDGNTAAYCTWNLGIYKVFLMDLETGKKKMIYRGGYRLAEKPDFTFPVLAWHPTGKVLAIMIERKGECYLYFYNTEDHSKEHRILYEFDKILDMSYSDDGTLMVMSAVQKGQSDIYVYNIAAGSHEQLTKDVYNDLNPRFIDGSTHIIFASNRNSDTIRFDPVVDINKVQYNNDIFVLDYKGKSPLMKRITKTPDVDEIQPQAYMGNYYTYLSNENGVYNRFMARYDSAVSFVDTTTHYRYFTSSYPVTNYTRSILELDVSGKGARIGEVVFMNKSYKMFARDLVKPEFLETVTLAPAQFRIQEKPKVQPSAKPNLADSVLRFVSQEPAQPAHSRFSTVRVKPPEKGKPGTSDSVTMQQLQLIAHAMSDTTSKGGFRLQNLPKKDTLNKYKNAKQLNYNVEYSIDQMVTQIDFTYLNWAYQPFSNSSSPIYINPGFNALFMVGVTDLMEDYRITGGVRLNFNLVNNEYMLSYAIYKKRLDHQIIFHRQSVEEATDFSIIRHRINELYYILTYPFNPVMNIKGTVTFRYDRAVYLSTDPTNLATPDNDRLWISLKGELTYDNTRSLGLNLYRGTRYKFFGEAYHLALSGNINCFVLGVDFRNYQKIHRTLIWANRFAASTSFGSGKLIYYLGGEDNWLFPSFNSNTPVAQNQNYVFQTLATNLRGFNQNIRNGNSFFVINSELRMPVFRYFFNRPIRSDFLNNFQVVAFGDVGTAWTGTSPWSSDNQLFTSYISRNPLFIKVETIKDPLVEGFGFGLRSRLLGYFLRGDLAWGVEDGRVLKPVFYLSLSLDF
jgi:Tol biopolymer transport system component